MRKVLILGSGGAGKSTLAARLAAISRLPLIHLDAHFWQAGWRETPRDEWKARVAELLRGDAWIMDGNYGGTLPERVVAADTVILLDLPRIQCIRRVIMRSIRYRGRTRADLNPECAEQLPDWAFLRYIWSYPRAKLPQVLALLRANEAEKTIVILRSTVAVEEYVAMVTAGVTSRKGTPAETV